MNEQDPCSKRWQRRPQARPEEILKAALQAFVHKGFAATRLEEVAALAGVSKGTVYLYFPSKEDLFKAMVSHYILPHIRNVEELVAGFEGSPTALLRIVFERWATFLMQEDIGGIIKLVVSEAKNFPDIARFYIDEVVLRLRHVFTEVLTRGMAAEEFRHMDVELAVRELVTPVIFAAIWKHSLAPFDPRPISYQEYLPAHIEFVLRSLAP